MTTRKVRIFSTKVKAQIDTDVTNWGDLKNILRDRQIPYSGMTAALSGSNLSLESNAAQLPNTDFVLYLMPQKTKSGINVEAFSYMDLRQTIQSIIETTGDVAKNFFNDELNYTRKNASQLRVLLQEWNKQVPVASQENVELTNLIANLKSLETKHQHLVDQAIVLLERVMHAWDDEEEIEAEFEKLNSEFNPPECEDFREEASSEDYF